MSDKFKIATVVLSLVLTFDTVVHYRNKKKFDKMREAAKHFARKSEYLDKYSDYLAEKLEENDIPMTEFDRIALYNLM